MRKINRNTFNRIIAITLIGTICEVAFCFTPIKVLANERCEEEIEEQFKEEHPLDYYLYEQELNDTGVIDENIEIILNDNGVFDSEIETMTEEEIEDI